MPFQVSPGVNTSEIDLTTVVPAVSTTEGALAGHFRWGPVSQRVLINSEDTLVDTFNKPNANCATDWFTAANFLSYGNKLYIVRTNVASSNNATSSGVGKSILNEEDYDNNHNTGTSGAGNWVAKYPGILGNSLKVSICQSANTFESTLSSNIAYTDGSTTVTSNVALFTTEVSVGDLLVLGPDLDIRKVASIESSKSLTLETAYSGNSVTNKAQGAAGIKRRWEFHASVDATPGTSAYATTRGGSGDELHVVVADEDGEWTDTKGQVLEIYNALSRAEDGKTEEGGTNFYKEVINQKSRYIWWGNHDSVMTSAGGLASATYTNTSDLAQTDSLNGGRDGASSSNAEKIIGYDMFKSPEDVDVSLVLGSDADSTVATHLINNIAEVRKDCIAVLSPERADVVNNASYTGAEMDDVIAFRDALPSSSYATLDSGWKYQFDKYNDLYRFVPLNGDVAGLMVRTDNTRDPWYSPAGFNRGNIKNVVKLPYNPLKAQRDQLYKSGINPIVTFPGQGTVMFGDKTLLAKPSAFDRINVRRLFIVLEKAISTASKFTLFEFNDDFTRAQFRNMVEPFLRDVQGRRGIFDFRVVCDESNNTGEVIDRNEFIGDIYIKPARSINFIQLNFVAVRTGVEFEEVVGQF